MPRNSGQQALCGEKIASLTDVKTGDLIQCSRRVGILTKDADLGVHAPELNWDDSSNYIFHAKQRVRVE